MRFSYAVQPTPGGLAQAFLIGRDFVGADTVTLVLGDNIFFGHTLPDLLRNATARPSGGTIFAYEVQDPQRYGVVSFDAPGAAVALEEKPAKPKSTWAVTGLYVYDNQVLDIAAVAASPRRAASWRSPTSTRPISSAARCTWSGSGAASPGSTPAPATACWRRREFVRTIQHRQALPIGCLEEIAFRQGWIDMAELAKLAAELRNTRYGAQLESVLRSSANQI